MIHTKANLAAGCAIAALLTPMSANAGDPGRDDRPPAARAQTAGVVYQLADPYPAPPAAVLQPAPVEPYVYEMAPAPVQGSVYAAPVYEPPIYQAPAPIYAPPENTYDAGRYGGDAEFGHTPSSACGGLLHGEKCLVVIDDHIRRIRLARPAATVVVGNPAIADVTVLGKETLFVSARSTGATNLIILDDNDDLIESYQVYVRTSEIKRVTLRNGMSRETYQCAPNCERTLNPADTPDAHSSYASIISTESSIDQAALGLQSGSNPNTDAQQELLAGAQAAAAGAAASGAPGAALPPSARGGLPADLQALVASTGLLGSGGGAPAAPAPAPAQPPAAQPTQPPAQPAIPPALLDAFGQMMR